MTVWSALPRDRLLVDVSLWSADLAALGDEVRRIAPFTDVLHIDVCDAHLAPGLLFFPDLVAALRPLTSVPFHVHLMVENPIPLIDDFVAAGADALTVHHEIGGSVPDALERIRRHGRAAGLAIQLDSSTDAVIPYLGDVELVLMMGTRLGLKGQDLAPTACARIADMRRILHDNAALRRVVIEADGGLRRHTVPALRAAGADLISPGSLIFGTLDPSDVFHWLRTLPAPLPVR